MADRHLRSLLDFFDHLVGDDIRVSTSQLEVRFAAGDISEAERPILESIVRYRSGVVVDLRRVIVDSPETLKDPPLARRLSTAGSAGGLRVDITQTEKRTEVKLGGAAPAGSKGLATVAGALMVPFLRVVRSHELAVVVYDQNVLDTDQGHVLWDLYAEHLGTSALGALRRLVVIAESTRPNHDLYLRAPGRSANALLFGDQLTRRRTWSETVKTARGMLDESCLVLFLAAGFSVSSRPMPLGNDLRDHAIREVVGELEGKPNFPVYKTRLSDLELLGDAERNIPIDEWAASLTFERVMKAELPSYGNDPMRLPAMKFFVEAHRQALRSVGSSVLVLRRLLRAQLESTRRSIIPVTINFDELLEADASLPFDVLSEDSDFERVAESVEYWLRGGADRIPYLKLHGTLTNPRSLVISTSQTDLRLSASKRSSLDYLVTKNPRWVYLGTSMRDRDLYSTFADFAVDEDWVAPSVARTVQDFCERHRLERWTQGKERRLAARLHSLTADGFMRAMLEAAGFT